MIWGNILLFIAAATKFLFAPLAGLGLGNSFIITLLVVITGGWFGATIFFYFTDDVARFIGKLQFIQNAITQIKKWVGIKPKQKRTFTKTNRLIVRIKQLMGVFGLSIIGCFVISIPISAAIAGKLYKHNKYAILGYYAGVIVSGTIITSFVYLF